MYFPDCKENGKWWKPKKNDMRKGWVVITIVHVHTFGKLLKVINFQQKIVQSRAEEIKQDIEMIGNEMKEVIK